MTPEVDLQWLRDQLPELRVAQAREGSRNETWMISYLAGVLYEAIKNQLAQDARITALEQQLKDDGK